MAEKKKLPKGISIRKDGTYMARFQHQNQSYTVYANTLKKVQKKMMDLRYEVEHGIFVKQEKTTVDDWFNTWLDVYKKPSVKAGTIANYKINYEKHIKSTFGKWKLKDVKTAHIQKGLNDIAENYSKGVVSLVNVVWMV